jgi:ribonuclease PH
VLVSLGHTVVLCTCSIEPKVPDFLVGKGQGWLTAEYSMLPGSTQGRKARDKAGKIDGRSVEIQRLIGRSLRSVIQLDKLGECTVWIDCDVLDADGGTRTASINGAYVALVMALHNKRDQLPCPIQEIITSSVAAISVGVVKDEEMLDLCYVEDRDASVDFNVVMTGTGQFIEVQGTGEEATFTRNQLDKLIQLAEGGIRDITNDQRQCLQHVWAKT